MPVVRRGDEHRVNVWPRQQFAVVVDGRAMAIIADAALGGADLVRLARARIAAGGIHIAYGDQLGFLVAGEDVQMPAAHSATANEADIDALAGCDGAVAGADGRWDNPGHRQQRSRCTASKKGAAGEACVGMW